MNTQKKEIDILDLLTALHAGRWLIIGGPLAICVLAGGLSFLLPKEYEATVQILPPQDEKQSFGFFQPALVPTHPHLAPRGEGHAI